MQSGIEYPTITLGGSTYTVKLTRGTLRYRLSRIGLADMREIFHQPNYSKMVDLLHASMEPAFMGSQEALAEQIDQDDMHAELGRVLGLALIKVFPPATQAQTLVTEQAPLKN